MRQSYHRRTFFSGTYEIVGVFFGSVSFICMYIWCIGTHGWLVGGVLGWVPSVIVFYLACWLWPVVLFGAALIFLVIQS